MVQPGGVEPPTYRSVVCRSIQLSYGCTCPTCGGRIVEQPAARCNPWPPGAPGGYSQRRERVRSTWVAWRAGRWLARRTTASRRQETRA
jgi:hypothetical protein